MDDNISKNMEGAAAFQKLLTDSFNNMAGVWSKYSPGSPPPDEMRKMRSGALKVLADTWDDFMRTPQFMEMMKSSLSGALDFKRMTREGMDKIHEQFETPDKEDINGVLLAIRHVERRVLDRLEGLDERLGNLDERVGKVDERLGKVDGRMEKIEASVASMDDRIEKLDDHVGRVDGRVGRIDDRIGKLEEAREQPTAAATRKRAKPAQSSTEE